jgi:hypothetical protein
LKSLFQSKNRAEINFSRPKSPGNDFSHKITLPNTRLHTSLPYFSLIAERMAAANRNGHYKPIRSCILLKECNKNQASLDADEMRALRSLAMNDSMAARVEDLLPTTTTLQPLDLALTTDTLTEGRR